MTFFAVVLDFIVVLILEKGVFEFIAVDADTDINDRIYRYYKSANPPKQLLFVFHKFYMVHDFFLKFFVGISVFFIVAHL